MSIQVVSTTEAAVQAEKPALAGEGAQSAPEASAAEQNKPTATGAEETETKAETEEKDDESEEDEGDEPEAKADDSEKDKPKKKSGSQRRKERAERAEAEVERLQRLMEQMALKGAGDPKPETPALKPAAAVEGKPNPDSYDTHTEYVEALTDWKIEQREKAKAIDQQKTALQTEHEKAIQSHTERVKSYAEKIDDWADTLADVDDVRTSPVVQEIIITSEHGPALMYELAKNRAEFERICKLPPLAAARELGRLEAKVSANVTEKKEPEPKKLTKAPQPIAPVGSKGGSVAKSIHDPNLSQKEYEALRAKQRSAS